MIPNRELFRNEMAMLCLQVLRSVGEWSAGTATETSIQNAYRDTIARAEHFIYIEVRYPLHCDKISV